MAASVLKPRMRRFEEGGANKYQSFCVTLRITPMDLTSEKASNQQWIYWSSLFYSRSVMSDPFPMPWSMGSRKGSFITKGSNRQSTPCKEQEIHVLNTSHGVFLIFTTEAAIPIRAARSWIREKFKYLVDEVEIDEYCKSTKPLSDLHMCYFGHLCDTTDIETAVKHVSSDDCFFAPTQIKWNPRGCTTQNAIAAELGAVALSDRGDRTVQNATSQLLHHDCQERHNARNQVYSPWVWDDHKNAGLKRMFEVGAEDQVTSEIAHDELNESLATSLVAVRNSPPPGTVTTKGHDDVYDARIGSEHHCGNNLEVVFGKLTEELLCSGCSQGIGKHEVRAVCRHTSHAEPLYFCMACRAGRIKDWQSTYASLWDCGFEIASRGELPPPPVPQSSDYPRCTDCIFWSAKTSTGHPYFWVVPETREEQREAMLLEAILVKFPLLPDTAAATSSRHILFSQVCQEAQNLAHQKLLPEVKSSDKHKFIKRAERVYGKTIQDISWTWDAWKNKNKSKEHGKVEIQRVDRILHKDGSAQGSATTMKCSNVDCKKSCEPRYYRVAETGICYPISSLSSETAKQESILVFCSIRCQQKWDETLVCPKCKSFDWKHEVGGKCPYPDPFKLLDNLAQYNYCRQNIPDFPVCPIARTETRMVRVPLCTTCSSMMLPRTPNSPHLTLDFSYDDMPMKE